MAAAERTLSKLNKGKKWAKFLKQCKRHGLSLDDLRAEDADISDLVAQVAQAEQEGALLSDAERRHADLEAKMRMAQKHLERAKAMDALLNAFGNAGLKRSACATLAEKVERNLNAVAPLMFDDYKFHFDVTPKDFRILFEDKRGAFDVRNLSGAESRCFTVLSMLAMLPLLPSRYRSNILILDEVDVNLRRHDEGQIRQPHHPCPTGRCASRHRGDALP